jgi:hypothetical protein
MISLARGELPAPAVVGEAQAVDAGAVVELELPTLR